MATVSHEALSAGRGDAAFHQAKLKTARFYFARVLPECGTLLTAMQAGAASIMAFEQQEF